MNPKYQRYANRISELINAGYAVAKLEKRRGRAGSAYIGDEDVVALQAWLVSVRNILEIVFSSDGPQVRHFDTFTKQGLHLVEHAADLYPIIGVLKGALEDLEKGYLVKQEFLVAGGVLDSVLEEAEQLNKAGYKDAAAVLARVVLEDALRRIAREETIDDDQKTAAFLNDELKKIDRYPQPQWRLIQAWLDIGNCAAHGEFDNYDEDAVETMIQGIEQFLAAELN